MSHQQGVWEAFDDMAGVGHYCLCLLQDARGLLWIGTGSGLSQYDGKRFVTFAEADGLAGSSVFALCEDQHGRLWIGTDKGLTLYDRGRFHSFTEADGLVRDYTQCLHVDA